MPTTFTIAGRTITLEPDASGLPAEAWKVLVDGSEIPMTVSETETVTTNSGETKKILAAPTLSPGAPLGPLAESTEPVEPYRSGTGWMVLHSWVTDSGTVYNTAVYYIDRLQLQFPPDLSSVSVVINHHKDLSD
jgi:hypothetical protein